MSSIPTRADLGRGVRRIAGAAAFAVFLAGCASTNQLHVAQDAENAQDYDRAVVEYTKIVRANPADKFARAALDRVKLRAAQDHVARGRRLAGLERFEEAVVEFQLATELNPSDTQADAALKDARQKLRAQISVTRGGQTQLETLVTKMRDLPPSGQELPADIKLPGSLQFGNGATSRAVFLTVGHFANLSVIFDSTFRDAPLSIDLRNATLSDALSALTASTHTFYKVTAPKTVTIIPDTPAKRREYEESVVQTFYLSNADVKETIDLLRIVDDIRQISAITATNAISIKDTPERIAAAAKLIAAIDKARPEVVIDVELLEVDRDKLKEYGLQIASPGQPGISGSADVNRANFTLQNLLNLSASDVVLSGVPGIYYKLLKSDTATRTLANPHIRAEEGISASAKFGDLVPVPMTTFAPIAAGGVNTQPITSYVYQNIGVNIDITPRIHHDDEVTLGMKVSISSIEGTGFANLPTFGNREITTTIRLKDGETNMLAGLIRDDERTILEGVPGLSDMPMVGHLFASNHKEVQTTDIILTLTPHIVRVLDLNENDLRPFTLGRDAGSAPLTEVTGPGAAREELPPTGAQPPAVPPTTAPATPPQTPFPQPLQGPLPGTALGAPTAPKKPGGGGG
jgi:general secretion pathway protein D